MDTSSDQPNKNMFSENPSKNVIQAYPNQA